MLQTDIQIHSEILDRLAALDRKGRLAHAYLFIGPSGIGKQETAVAVAKMFQCDAVVSGEAATFCDVCPSCLKIHSGNHPDVVVLKGSLKDPIKIDQIRDLLERVRLKPFYGHRKILVLSNVEYMTLESANALLKTLEEPSRESLLLLTTSSPERCLETIRSRCHTIFFSSLSSAALEARLAQAPGARREETHFLAYFAEGCWGRATQLAEGKFFERKNDYINGFILSEPADDFLKHVTETKEGTQEFLATMYSWTRDALLLKNASQEERVIHRDRLAELKNFSQRYSLEELRQIEQAVVKARKMLTENLNIKVPLMLMRTLIR